MLVASKLWALFQRGTIQRSRPRTLSRRLKLEELEDRSVPSANASGVVEGVAFIDPNGSHVFRASDTVLPGVTVNLSGTTKQGIAVNVNAITDPSGAYTFANVQPGTYHLGYATVPSLLGGPPGISAAHPPGITVVANLSVQGGQTISENLVFQGIAPQFISLRQFLSNTTEDDFSFAAAGSGAATASSRANSSPFVKTAIPNVAGHKNGSNTLDLAGFFSDPDLANSTVRFDTSAGPVNVQLFDAQAPQTVANFYDYVLSGQYNSTIFHRLTSQATDGLTVLQGGGFSLHTSAKGTTLPAISTNPPTVADEVGALNTLGTLAMAKTGSPNSATDQFFFNLADNSKVLSTPPTGHQTNGGFTVFGRVEGPADQQVLDILAQARITAESAPFNQVPLNNYTGTHFPTDATPSNFDVVQRVTAISRPESLTYSVVGNTNPGLVTATILNERLTLRYTTGHTGTATITVQATDQFGATVDTTVKVTVH